MTRSLIGVTRRSEFTRSDSEFSWSYRAPPSPADENSESLQVNPGKTPEPASVDPQRAPRLAGVASAKTRVSLLLPTHTHNPTPMLRRPEFASARAARQTKDEGVPPSSYLSPYPSP